MGPELNAFAEYAVRKACLETLRRHNTASIEAHHTALMSLETIALPEEWAQEAPLLLQQALLAYLSADGMGAGFSNTRVVTRAVRSLSMADLRALAGQYLTTLWIHLRVFPSVRCTHFLTEQAEFGRLVAASQPAVLFRVLCRPDLADPWPRPVAVARSATSMATTPPSSVGAATASRGTAPSKETARRVATTRLRSAASSRRGRAKAAAVASDPATEYLYVDEDDGENDNASRHSQDNGISAESAADRRHGNEDSDNNGGDHTEEDQDENDGQEDHDAAEARDTVSSMGFPAPLSPTRRGGRASTAAADKAGRRGQPTAYGGSKSRASVAPQDNHGTRSHHTALSRASDRISFLQGRTQGTMSSISHYLDQIGGGK